LRSQLRVQVGIQDSKPFEGFQGIEKLDPAK
jgi:hypothetical protein